MDSDLFMECEEEELEPWQLVDDDVEEDDMEIMEDNSNGRDDAFPSSPRTSYPSVPSATPPAGQRSQTTVLSARSSHVLSTATLSVRPNTIAPLMASAPMPAVASLLPTGIAQGQPLILTQTSTGLGTLLLPTVNPGTHPAVNQPIFLTAQGFPVRNVQPAQSSVGPAGFVLNMQQPQTFQPITLLTGSSNAQVFRPVVGLPQVVPHPHPAQVRPQLQTPQFVPPASPTPPRTTVPTIKIPATLTNHASQPGSASSATLTTSITTTDTQLTAAPITSTPHLHSRTQLDEQYAFSSVADFLKSQTSDETYFPCPYCSVPQEATEDHLMKRHYTFAIHYVEGGIAKFTIPCKCPERTNTIRSHWHCPKCEKVVERKGYFKRHLQNHVSKSSQQERPCPRCGGRFRMQEALQGHMCFCCPDIVNTTKTGTPGVNTTRSSSSVIPTNTSTSSVSTVNPPKLVMTVEHFYYGTKTGLQKPALNPRKTPFTCHICSITLIDNISMMSHMWLHSNQVLHDSGSNPLKSCQYCFRQFSSPQQWKCHIDKVHSPIEHARICMICEWVFESEPVFLNHMKATHKPGEMPYVCQVCEYSSSFHSHVYNHFLVYHRSTVYLLCVYCLKVSRNEATYQQHFLRHQKHNAFHCNKCRLQFVFVKELIEHKAQHHRTVCKPAELNGLPPGTKVTIRAGPLNKAQVPKRNPLMPPNTEFPPPFPMQEPSQQNRGLGDLKSSTQMKPLVPAPSHQLGKYPQKRKAASKMLDLLTKFQETSGIHLDNQRCMECSTGVSSFPNHYPTFVRCLLCAYSTCCSRSYADHMIHKHVSHANTKSFPLHKQPPPCCFKLQCHGCGFNSPTGDLMAKHLAQYPDHRISCELKEYAEFDIEFCQDGEEGEQERNEDLQKPAWALMEHWTEPLPAGAQGAIPMTLDFTEGSGPQHCLSKNSDAIDYFNLLFPNELVELIAYETNAHVKTCQFLGWHDLDWIPVTTNEIKVFIGLSILMGLQNRAELKHYWSWRHNDNCHIYYQSMTVNRFQQISANICMGSLLTEEYCGNSNSDRLHIFRPMLNILGNSMWDAYWPNRCLTIDRALLPSHEEEVGSTKADPKAPPQVWLLCDSKSGYCHRFLIQMENKKDTNLAFSVVPPLVKGLHEKHHQLFLASSLISVPLMQKLLDQGIYSSSSFPAQSPILPMELWEQGRLEKPGDFLQRQYGPLLATRWMDTKEMGCLSTNAKPGEPDTVWRKSHIKVGELCPISRPQAFRLLQENMRGVDICKQLLACNPLGGLQPNKYWRSLFWFLVNLSIVNAFIVLRESRKDNPPHWVQDGLFTQATFRKRLGNHLVKSAQKHTRVSTDYKVDAAQKKGHIKVQVKKETSVLQQGEDGLNTVRHRMVRLTPKTKRCRACHLKNLRHESVYGCIICKVNLCKRPFCFWEYHGFPPETRGNIKVGFIEEKTRSRSSQWTTPDQEEDIDLGMAPVEEMDSDTDDESQYGEEPGHEERAKPPLLLPVPSKPLNEIETAPPVVKVNKELLSARQLRITLFALCGGVSQASAEFSTQPQLIRKWLSEKRRQLKHDGRKRDKSKATESIVEWVLSQHEQQLPVNERNLFHKASQIHMQGGFSGSFRISYDWAVGFMLQHNLGLQPPGRTTTVGLGLPRSMKENICDFTKFTCKFIQVHKLPHTAIAAMDELSVFVDFKWLADETKMDKQATFQLAGSEEPLFRIYLAALADGTMLPSLVLMKEPLPVSSNYVIMVPKTEDMTREKELDLWVSRVWQQHVPEKTLNSKAMLILDGHPEHVSSHFLDTLSDNSTLPAVIPAGCTGHIQPLEMCIRPMLQRFLTARWAQLAAEGGLAGASCKDVVQLLVNWLIEALTCLAKQPELVQQSFHLTGLLTEKEYQETPQNLEKSQTQLLNTFARVLLGPELAALELACEEDTSNEDTDVDGKADYCYVTPQSALKWDEDRMDVEDTVENEDEEKTDDEDEDEDRMDKDWEKKDGEDSNLEVTDKTENHNDDDEMAKHRLGKVKQLPQSVVLPSSNERVRPELTAPELKRGKDTHNEETELGRKVDYCNVEMDEDRMDVEGKVENDDEEKTDDEDDSMDEEGKEI